MAYREFPIGKINKKTHNGLNIGRTKVVMTLVGSLSRAPLQNKYGTNIPSRRQRPLIYSYSYRISKCNVTSQYR